MRRTRTPPLQLHVRHAKCEGVERLLPQMYTPAHALTLTVRRVFCAWHIRPASGHYDFWQSWGTKNELNASTRHTLATMEIGILSCLHTYTYVLTCSHKSRLIICNFRLILHFSQISPSAYRLCCNMPVLWQYEVLRLWGSPKIWMANWIVWFRFGFFFCLIPRSLQLCCYKWTGWRFRTWLLMRVWGWWKDPYARFKVCGRLYKY